MSDAVECPFCDTKYNIIYAKNGSVLTCVICNKVLGTIKDGNLAPLIEPFTTPNIRDGISASKSTGTNKPQTYKNNIQKKLKK